MTYLKLFTEFGIGLLLKLKQKGVEGELLKWIENYLLIQVSRLGQHQTQGSILVPLFFLVYVNDIDDYLLSITRLFADDTLLAQSTTNINYLESILNHDLQIISDWSKR